MDSVAPHRLVDSLQERIRSLEVEFHRAYWDSQVEANDITEHRRAELELELRRVKGDGQSLAEVNAALQEDLHEPLLLRKLEILRLSLTGNQMDDETRAEVVALSSAVESEFASFRPEVDGRRVSDNEIIDILMASDDSDLRRRAWEASKEVGSRVAERVRELARLRNRAAHELGFADYYRMSLELQEIGEEWLFRTLEDIERLTAEPFKRWKNDLDARLSERFGTDQLDPWHYADPFFQDLPRDGQVDLDTLLEGADAVELANRTFGLWGIDLSAVMDGSDLFPRERKCQHAFCLDVDRTGSDVRILANVVPGEHWISVMLHESGHAAYDLAIDPKLPYLLHRPSHTFTTEAMAILSGRLVRNPGWLVDVARVDASEVARIEAQLVRANAAADLLMARWVAVMSYFERELYSDPEADLDSLWWEQVERFQMVAAPPDRGAPDWAAKIHLSVAPVYYHNYLLGAVLASQVERACERDCGDLVRASEAGAWLAERLFRSGAALRWDSLVEQATGAPLSADGFADHVSASNPT